MAANISAIRASRSAIRLRFFAAATRLIARNTRFSAFLGEVPYTDATLRNETLPVLESGNSLANSAALAPDAGTLASRAIRLNKDRGRSPREDAVRDTLCTDTLLTCNTFVLTVFRERDKVNACRVTAR